MFVNQATQVNAWDKLLIANGEKIVTLNQEVERVKQEQQQLEHELDYVVSISDLSSSLRINNVICNRCYLDRV